MKRINISDMLEKNDYITIDIVGDSITEGTNHCTLSETYVAQFTEMLAEKYPEASVYRYDGITEAELLPMKGFSKPVEINKADGKKRIDVIKNGIGGNTVRRAINRINDFTRRLANGRSADITVFMFGINDALKSDPQKYVLPDKFAEDYKELLYKFRQTEKSKIVIMSATTNDQCIDEYVEAAKRIAYENDILYVDQNSVWNNHYNAEAPNFGHGDWLSGVPFDACHPTPKGAYAIAKKLFEYVN